MTGDLRFLIALDALRTGIPVGDIALRVEHIDGVIGNALHQKTKALLTFLKRLFRLTALGEVAGDLGEAEQVALRVDDRIDDHMGPEPRAVFPYPPSLAFEAACARGFFQRSLGKFLRTVRLGVEGGEVPAENLVSLVPLEPRAPGFQLLTCPSRSSM